MIVINSTTFIGASAIWLILGVGPVFGAQPMGCLIEPQQVAEVGAPAIGIIEAVLVERGDRVAKGQVIARLRSDVERAAVAVANSRTQAEADELTTRTSLEFARQKLERAQYLQARKFVSQQAVDQARTEVELAEQKSKQVLEQKHTARQELGLTQAQLAQRAIRSPFDGIVAERYSSVGERVEEKPLFRIARINPLKVQVVVPASFYGKIQLGASATVQPQLPDMVAVTARVTLVDKLIDGPSNTFRVQLELPNPDLSLPAGVRCKADVGPALLVATRQASTAVSSARIQQAIPRPAPNLLASQSGTAAGPKRSY